MVLRLDDGCNAELKLEVEMSAAVKKRDPHCSVGIMELTDISRSPRSTPLCFFLLKQKTGSKINTLVPWMSSKFHQFKFPVQRPQPAPTSKVKLKRG